MKSMSTKTSIKRVALVVAAALALGGFSAVSARAADNLYIGGALGDGVSSYSLANTTLTGVAGAANFVQVGFEVQAAVVTITGGTFGAAAAPTKVVVNTAGTQAVVASDVTQGSLLNIPTPTVEQLQLTTTSRFLLVSMHRHQQSLL